MFLDDDDRAAAMPKKKKDLAPFSVTDLEAYIDTLLVEVDRARAELQKKQAYKTNLDGFFKKKGDDQS